MHLHDSPIVFVVKGDHGKRRRPGVLRQSHYTDPVSGISLTETLREHPKCDDLPVNSSILVHLGSEHGGQVRAKRVYRQHGKIYIGANESALFRERDVHKPLVVVWIERNVAH